MAANVDDVVSVLSSPSVADALRNRELQDAIHKLLSPIHGNSAYDNVTIWVLIVSVIIASVSAILVWRQLKADHERSRRELAVNLLREWTTGQEIETASAVRLVRLLNSEQCGNLVSREPFTLANTDKHREHLIGCLEYRFPNIRKENEFENLSENEMIHVNATYAAYIRFMAVGYLNLLESIMVAWDERVAQPRIIEGQFRFLRRSKEVDLSTFRSAMEKENDTDPFPCITRFVANMQPRYSSRPGFADSWFFWRGPRDPR